MARRSRRQRDSSHIATVPRLLSLDEVLSLTRPVSPSPPVSRPVGFAPQSDGRRFRPERRVALESTGRPAKVIRAAKVIRGPGGAPMRSASARRSRVLRVALGPEVWAFANPKFTDVCLRRAVRRRVLAAAGFGRVRKWLKRRRNKHSNVRC